MEATAKVARSAAHEGLVDLGIAADALAFRSYHPGPELMQ